MFLTISGYINILITYIVHLCTNIIVRAINMVHVHVYYQLGILHTVYVHVHVLSIRYCRSDRLTLTNVHVQ